MLWRQDAWAVATPFLVLWTMAPAVAAERIRRLLADPPDELAGSNVADVTAFPEAGLVRLTLEGGARVQVRPSGTEPKVKGYLEVVLPVTDGDLIAGRRSAAAYLSEIEAEVTGLLA